MKALWTCFYKVETTARSAKKEQKGKDGARPNINLYLEGHIKSHPENVRNILGAWECSKGLESGRTAF